jgi:hypothetical protein
VQNPDDLDSTVDRPMKDHVSSNRVTSHGRPHLMTFPAHAWMLGQAPKLFDYRIDQTIRRREIIAGYVEPYGVEIVVGERG